MSRPATNFDRVQNSLETSLSLTYRNFNGFAVGQVLNCQAFVRSSLDYSVVQFVFLSNNLYFTKWIFSQALKPTSK